MAVYHKISKTLIWGGVVVPLTCMLGLSPVAAAGSTQDPVTAAAGKKPVAAVDSKKKETKIAATTLEAVVVTAQKRSQNLQDVPISITALTAEDIEKEGIHNTEDLVYSTPSLSMRGGLGGRGNIDIIMRGIDSGGFDSVDIPPANAVYQDGVNIGSMTGLSIDDIDIERIEVLRGPQGTLYGRNSIGGAINYISREPSGKLGLKVTGTTGNYDLRGVKALIDLPAFGTPDEGLGTIATQFSFYQRKRADFYGNTDPARAGFSNLNRKAWRFAAKWQIRDNLKVNYAYNHSEADEHTDMLNLVGFTPLTFGGATDIDALKQIQQNFGSLAPNLGPYADRYIGSLNRTLQNFENIPTDAGRRPSMGSADHPSYSTNGINAHTLTVEWHLQNLGVLGDVTLKSITGYRDNGHTEHNDLDGMDNSLDPVTGIGALNDATLRYLASSPRDAKTVFDAIDLMGVGGGYFNTDNTNHYEQRSEELQLLGSTETLNYVLGLYWSGNNIRSNSARSFDVPLAGRGVGAFTSESESKAAYSQVTWTPPIFEDRFSIDAGLRFTQEQRGITYWNETTGSPLAFAAFGLPWTNTMLPEQPSSWVGPPGTVGFTDFAVDQYGRKATKDFSNTSGMLGLKYQWTSDIMTYLKYSTGYASGGYSGASIALPSPDPNVGEPLPYKPSKIKNIEVGLKSDLWDHRLRINAAAYRYKYSNQQISQLVVDPVTLAANNNIINAGLSKRWGTELSVELIPVEDMLIALNWSHISGNYDRYPNFCSGLEESTCIPDPAGKARRLSPDNQASIVVDWTFLQNDFATFNAHLGAYWQDASPSVALYTLSYGGSAGGPITIAAPRDLTMLDGRTLVNGRITMGDIQVGGGTLEVALWGKNLTNKEYKTFGLNLGALGPIVDQYGDPRTYGLDVTYRF